VREIVEKQVAAGIDSVCDGELGKISYTFYVRHRLCGITSFRGGELERPPQTAAHRDLLDHPDFMQRLKEGRGGTAWFSREAVPCCTGPVAYANRGPLETDLPNLAAACSAGKPVEAFMNAASPGVLTKFVPDRYYRDEDAYVDALANALKEEYEAIAGAGFILQIDAPDLGSARHNQYQHLSDHEFLRVAERNIAALNHATANIPPEAMRMHLCWGNYEGPHTHDIPLAKIFDVCMWARPAGSSFEAANPRHAHEWEDLRGAKIPDDKILIPGVIDSTTNFVEHPRLVAQRIRHYADIVGGASGSLPAPIAALRPSPSSTTPSPHPWSWRNWRHWPRAPASPARNCGVNHKPRARHGFVIPGWPEGTGPESMNTSH